MKKLLITLMVTLTVVTGCSSNKTTGDDTFSVPTFLGEGNKSTSFQCITTKMITDESGHLYLGLRCLEE